MVAGNALHRDRMGRRAQLAVAEGQIARLVMPKLMAAQLRAEHDRESRIPRDIDAIHRIHLDGDAQWHGSTPLDEAASRE